MTERKPVQLPRQLWERIKSKAEREGRTIVDVIKDLVDQIPDFDETTTKAERSCILCGAPSGMKHICDNCFFDPEVIRPQRVANVYFAVSFKHKMETGRLLGVEEFAQQFTEEDLANFKLTADEWDTFKTWLDFRQKFRSGELTIDNPVWRKFVVLNPINLRESIENFIGMSVRAGGSGREQIGEIINRMVWSKEEIKARRREKNAGAQD